MDKKFALRCTLIALFAIAFNWVDWELASPNQLSVLSLRGPDACNQTETSETLCSDGLDNDCDGLIDSVDTADCGDTTLVGLDDLADLDSEETILITAGKLVWYEVSFNDTALVGDAPITSGTGDTLTFYFADGGPAVTSITFYGYVFDLSGSVLAEGTVATTEAEDEGTWVDITLDQGVSITTTNVVLALGGDESWYLTRDATRPGSAVTKTRGDNSDLGTLTSIATNGYGATGNGPHAIYLH